MDSLYLWINLGSLSIPFLFSFHPKLKFYKKWKYLFPSIAIMMLFFISWDIVFTKEEIWGFNQSYLTGPELFHLPLEEWLFFICIPYASVFTHFALKKLYPEIQLSPFNTTIIYVILITALLITTIIFYSRWYTLVNFTYAIILLGLTYNYRRKVLQTYFLTFLVILIPFFIVNGILTGSFIEEPIVWYALGENLGVRLLTIPMEDTIYAFSMLLTVIVLMEYFEDRKEKKTETA